MRLEIVESADAAARKGASEIAAAARAAVAERGAFTLAVSGGEGPWMMFAQLADEEVPWDRTGVFQVDERIAPRGSPERNLTHLEQSLPAQGLEGLRPMPVDAEDLEGAALEYGEALPESIDFVHLGIGPDGHTASLVPGDSVLDVTDRPVTLTAGEYQGRRRMTLTYPALAAARRIMWHVTGEDKREPLARLLAGDRSIPAGRVDARDALVIADQAAAP